MRLLRDGAEAYPAMLRAIESATDQVLIEMYWFSTQGIGETFLASICRASKRGVQVWLMFDALGSIGLDATRLEQARQAGVRIASFHPIWQWQTLLRLERLTRRNHRKLLCVDGWRAFVGGVNIADEWLSEEAGGQGWRDDVADISGPVARELSVCIRESWRDVGLSGPQPMMARKPCGATSVAVLSQAGFRQQRDAIRAYTERIRDARCSVYIANAYFIPGPRLMRELLSACNRGLDVRIMIPAESDVALVRHASRRAWTKLHSAGARVFQWLPSMLHSKTAVVDGSWVTLGSLNLDYLSLRRNLELNVSVQDAEFGRTAQASFLRDLECCVEVTADQVHFRSLGERMTEALCYWLRAWL